MSKNFLEDYKQFTRDNNIPFSLHWTITEACNLKCKHCFIPKTACKVKIEDVPWIIDFLKEKKFLSISLSGGECLTHTDFRDIYIQLKQEGFLVSVLTNATLFSPEIKELFIKYPPYKVEVSIYGKDEDDYYETTGDRKGFSEFLNNLRFLQENRIKTLIKSPITKKNYNKLNELVKIAKNYGMDYKFGTFIYASLDGDKEVLKERIDLEDFDAVIQQDPLFLEGYKDREGDGCVTFENKCGACTNNYVLNPDNSFSFCAMMVEPKFYFQKNTINDAFNKVTQYREIVKRQYDESPCSSCTLSSKCPGCPAHLTLENSNHLTCVDYFYNCISKFKLAIKNN